MAQNYTESSENWKSLALQNAKKIILFKIRKRLQDMVDINA